MFQTLLGREQYEETMSDERPLPYSSTDSWKPPIHVSDWLVFCCGNKYFIKKKERNENDKNTNFMMKTTKKSQEST